MIAYASRKGKTYEEIYGPEKAKEMRRKNWLTKSNRPVLMKARALAIIQALYKKPRYMRNLQEEAGGSASTILSRVDELEDAGLVTTKYEETHPNRRLVTLTTKGESLARAYLSAMERLPREI